jgi:Ni,Fe-hydrogenase I small subunit
VTDDGVRQQPRLRRAKRWLLAAAAVVAVTGAAATQVLNASVEPRPTGSGVDFSVPSSTPVVPTPGCGKDADFAPCSLGRMTCEELAAHYRAHQSPDPSPARITVRLCADGTQAQEGR